MSLLAKSVAVNSFALKNNVNRVTDRLTSKNPQVITLSTLREMCRSLVRDDQLDESEVDGLSEIIASFYDMLSAERDELGRVDVSRRKEIRNTSLVDSAVMMHGYAGLMRNYMSDMGSMGTQLAKSYWKERLNRLSCVHRYETWSGDLFEKINPLWLAQGVVKPNSAGTSISQVNNGATRATTARVLTAIIRSDSVPDDLRNLALR